VSAPRIDFPLMIDGGGRVALTDVDDHVRDMIEQVLFTRPGERPMRPDFGCGLAELVFEPNDTVLAAATELRVRAALQHWLSDVADVDRVAVRAEDSRLVIEVSWVRLLDSAPGESTFAAPGGRGGIT
jgi:phage baseplate assembly protein W